MKLALIGYGKMGKTIEEVAATVVDRTLDLAGMDISSFRWG